MTSANSSDADTTDARHGLLVHEWIEQIGGSENVLDEFARIFPRTDILSLWNNARSVTPATGCCSRGWLAPRSGAGRTIVLAHST